MHSEASGREPTVLVVEDDEAQRLLLSRWLEGEGYRLLTFEDGESCVAEMRRSLPDTVILDLSLPGMDGFEVLSRFKTEHPEVPVVMLTASEEVETVVTAIRLGAFEYLVKPTSPQRLLTTVRNALAQRMTTQRVRELEYRMEGGPFPGIVGASGPMLSLFADMRRVAPTDVNVLVRGGSGSGKELVARALHRTGGRSNGPFVAINCAAVPESLQESELFGHEKGAFTGATRRRLGRFEQADGGTLFLDEVGELAQGLQAKLLRVLQERTFHRVGGSDEVSSDFRLIVATHRDLAADAREGRFREDLYFRLAVFEIGIPPLRERGEDILLLGHTFARDLGVKINGEASELLPETAAALRAYDWPGNVRELENAIQRAVLMAPGREIPPWALPATVLGTEAPATQEGGRTDPDAVRVAPAHAGHASTQRQPGSRVTAGPGAWDRILAGLTLAQIEDQAIRAALRRHAGNRSRAAKELGIGRTTLYRKLERDATADGGSTGLG